MTNVVFDDAAKRWNAQPRVKELVAQWKEVEETWKTQDDDAKAAVASKNLSAVILISDRDQKLYGAKGASYAGDILAQAGIKNPAANRPGRPKREYS